jgi:hypothetical protein
MATRVASYAEFWPHYLRAHHDRRTRAAHLVGTGFGLVLVVAALLLGDWHLAVAAPIIGYACAWIGHAAFEGNRPATFGHPLWSLYSDFRMAALWVAGRLEPELEKAFKA